MSRNRYVGAAVATLLMAGLAVVLLGRSSDREGSGQASKSPSVARSERAVVPRPVPAPPQAGSVAMSPWTSTPSGPGVAGTVRGRIVDGETGAPIADAQISHWQAGRNVVTSDPQGAFALRALPTDKQLRLRVEKAGGYLADVINVMVPASTPEVDVGTTRLMRGNWDTRFGKGVQGLTGINSELRDGKVYVSKVRPGTPAQTAGIRVGDRIVAVDGKPVDGLGHRARSYLLQGDPGTDVTLSIETSGAPARAVTLRRMAGPGSAQWPFAQNRPRPQRAALSSPVPTR